MSSKAEACRRWREKNKDKTRSYNKKYKKEHQEYYKKYDQIRYEKRKKDPEYKEYKKWYDLFRLYGLTKDKYLEMLTVQEGNCAVCKKSLGRKTPRVDHCHVTKKIRGLLHDSCNKLLGYAYDDPEVLNNAAIYLKKPSLW